MNFMRLVLLRHGQTPSNVAGLLDTAAPGADLTALGRRQALAVPGALQEEDVDAIHVSPRARTLQTAAPLARAWSLAVTLHDGLREISAGDREMCGDPESKRIYIDTAMSWSTGTNERLFGGESGHEFLARYDSAIAAITDGRTGTSVVVSHGAAIRCWVAARARNISADFARAHALGNTGSVVLEHDEQGGWHAVRWAADPLGGSALGGRRGNDPTGDPIPPP